MLDVVDSTRDTASGELADKEDTDIVVLESLSTTNVLREETDSLPAVSDVWEVAVADVAI